MKRIIVLIFSLLFLLPCTTLLFAADPAMNAMTENDPNYIHWLEQQSMLYNASLLAKEVSGHGVQWQHSFAKPHTDQILQTASVWFNAYPSSMITAPGQDVLQFLGSSELWSAFESIGIQAMHTGPVKLAGGIVGKQDTPTVDGWFDRITDSMDPKFGTDAEYKAMVAMAAKHHAVIAGDVIPGHTGKGADFLLAEKAYKDYPGIYTMVQIRPEDWNVLPVVSNAWKSENLSPRQVTILTEKGYLPGHLQRVLFSVPGSKRIVTGWDATGVITGVDGVKRRWVYLHYFRPGQPTMNWLDPSFAANRLVAGDVIKTVHNLGAKIVRLDANSFLGIERKEGTDQAWSEGHPLSATSSDNIAWLIRKLGGWSFQELDLGLDSIKSFSQNGTDLSYDFITRPAVEHAILTRDTTFLRFMIRLMQHYKISPRSLIHDMQNHDELTYELVHFLRHNQDTFKYDGKEMTGQQIRDLIVGQMHKIALAPRAPYNYLSGNGLCTTMVGLLAARFNVKDIHHLTPQQIRAIQKGHFLLALFNAMQPGVFGISGWDLVGDLPLPKDQIQKLVADGDYRWINRGAYDLMGENSSATQSNLKMPKAEALYGPIPEQLKDPNSFVSQIKQMLQVRKKYRIAEGSLIGVIPVSDKSVLAMAFKLPDNIGYEILILNFGDSAVKEALNLHKIKDLHVGRWEGYRIIDALQQRINSFVKVSGKLKVKLEPLEGKVFIIKT